MTKNVMENVWGFETHTPGIVFTSSDTELLFKPLNIIPNKSSRSKVREETFNTVYAAGNNVYVTFANKTGTVRNESIIPNIVNVETIRNGDKDVGVMVEFIDGTSTKSVVAGDDKFDLETGISICITKKIIDMKTNGNGSSVYNKLVDYAVKVMKRNEAAGERYEKERAEKKRIYENKCRKKQKRRERREARLREQEIEIQKEAYLRAMREMKEENT